MKRPILTFLRHFSYFFFFFNRYQFPFLFAHIFFLRKSPYEGCTYDYTGTSAYRIWRLNGSEGFFGQLNSLELLNHFEFHLSVQVWLHVLSLSGRVS